MLNHFRKINPSLVTLLSARFGSHGAPVKIDIDKNATWIRYRANRRLACVQGIQDAHIPAPELIKDDPFGHTANKPFFSEQLFYYNDPFHHDLEFEKHTVGLQGYLENQDPHDTRYDIMYPGLAASVICIGLLILTQYADLDSAFSAQEMIQEGMAVETMVDQVLSRKAKIIEELEQQIEELTQNKN